jgi:hypothetical protein
MTTLREVLAGDVSCLVEARDVRPDGRVVQHWTFHSSWPVTHEYAPGMRPSPPWTRQMRLPGGEWEDFGGCREDGTWWRRGAGPEIIRFPAEPRPEERYE